MSKKDRETNRTQRAAAIQAAQARGERTRRILIALAVLVVLAAIVTAGVVFSGKDSTTPAAGATLPKAASSGQALVVGSNPSATKVVIYEDFLCPFCREFETVSRKFLQADAAKGKVLIEYRPFHLLPDDYSTRALTAWAAVLKNGTGAQALKFHDLLYDNQPYEAAANKPGVDQLVSLAKQAGVKDSAVLDAMRTPDATFVDTADSAAKQAGVQATPTVFVNGKELQGASVTDMATQLQQMLAQG